MVEHRDIIRGLEVMTMIGVYFYIYIVSIHPGSAQF